MIRKRLKRPNRRTARSLLGFETLETRLTPAVVFPHHFGNESTVDEGGDKLDAAPVFLLFWGNYWNQGTGAQERAQIVDGIRQTLDGPYLSGLAQYGVDWRAHFVNAVQINQDPPANFEYDDLKTVIQDRIAFQSDDPALYFPRPSSLNHDPLYLAITPPGVQSAIANAAGYHTAALQFFSLTDIASEAIGVAETGTLNGYTVVDQATTVLSHEIFEAITDPYSAYQDLGAILPFVDTTPGIRATPGAQWPNASPGESEIGDFESVYYKHRLNGTLVQAYWSQQDNASIVADGNIQKFILEPIWGANGFTGQSRLTIKGDQFAAGFDDNLAISTVYINGVETIRVDLNGEIAMFEKSKLGALPTAPFLDDIVIQLGGGKNHVDLSGYTSQLQIHVEQQTTPTISISDAEVREGLFNYVDVSIASIVSGNVSRVRETHPEVSVDFFAPASGGGTASPQDFAVLPLRLTFSTYDMRFGVAVNASNDTLMERDETFLVQLKNAVGGKIVDDTAVVTIIDDDLAPTFVTPTGPFDVNWRGNGRLVDTVPDSDPLRNYGTAVSGAAVDSNGRLVVLGGEVATGSDDNAIKLTRYLPNGERDLNFDGDGLVSLLLPNQSIYSNASGIAIYKNGPNRDKILVVGKYDVGGNSNSFVARFGIDGALDTTFGAGRGYIEVDYGTFPERTPYDHALDIAIYESGPYAGEFVLVGANENGRASSTEVSRHRADGSLDTTFGSGGKINFRLQYSDDHGGTDFTLMSRVLIDNNGKILLGGRAGVPGTYNGSYDTRTAAGALVRLNSNGSLDTSFGIQGAAFCNIEQGDGQGISDIAFQADGKILATVAGDGYYFGGRLVRFNQSGVLDLTMAPVAPTGYSAGQTVLRSVNVGNDGAVYVGGYATPIGASGFGDFVVARYQPTGTTLVLDAGFDTIERDGAITSSPSGSGVVSLVNTPDGGVLASGRGRNVQGKLAFATNKLESARSDLSVTMTSNVAETGHVLYTIHVQNSGSDAVFASLRDTLPANAKLLNVTAPEGWVTSPVGTTGNIEMTTRNLKPSDGIKTIILTVGFEGVGASGSVVNRVEASSAILDPNLSNNVATTTVDLRQNLSIDVGASRIDSVSAGTPVTFILDVTNQGRLPSSYQVSTTLPVNSTFVSATGNYTLVGRTVTWTESALRAGGHRSRLLNVVATADGYLVDQATVTGQFADATPADNTASNYTTLSLGLAPFSGLVSYYRAEDNTNDFTGAHPALNSTVIGYGAGHNGRGFVFNGTDTSVDLGPWFTGDSFQSFTINLWVNPARIQQTYADIFDNNHPANFVFQQDGNNLNSYVWGVYDGNSGNPFATLTSGQWQLLTVTRDNATLKDRIYVNGNQVGEMTASGPINYSNAFLRLGRWGSGGRNWNGLMDDVSIFSRALTPSEIQQLVRADMGVTNQPPTVSSDRPTLRVQQGQTAIMTGLVNDPDGFDSRLLLTASIGTAVVSPSQPGHFEWTLDTTGIPLQTTSVTITVNDGDGGITTTTFGLEVVPADPGTLRAELVGGDLQVTDVSTDDRDNRLTLDYGSTIVLSDANEKFISAPNGWTMSADRRSISIPAANYTHQIKILGAGGNDHLDVILHSGTPLSGGLIDFNGGSPNVFYSDSLSLSGDPLGAATLRLDAGNQGTIELSGVGQIHFANVNQFTDNSPATTIDAYLPVLGTTGASRPVLADDGLAGNGYSVLFSEISTFPTIAFVGPMQGLSIHSGGLSDRLRVQGAVDFRSSLTVGSQVTPFQSVEFSGGLSLGVDQSLTCFTYDAIRVNPRAQVELHGIGQLDLQSERRIEVGVGGLISTESGGITMHAGVGPLLSIDAFSGIVVNSATIQSASGDVLLSGHGIGHAVVGVDLLSSTIQSNTGRISLVGSTKGSLVADVLQSIHHDESGIGVSVHQTLIKTDSAIRITGTADITEAPGSGELFQGVLVSRSSRVDSQSDVNIEGTYNSAAVVVSPNLFGSRGDGVDIEGIISAKNGVVIHGTAFSAGAESYGVIAGGEIHSSDGAISITGDGGKAVGSRGVALAGFILGTAGVSITGSNQSNFQLAAVGSIGSEWIVTASAGNVSITGNADAAYDGFSLNDGVSLNNGTVAAQYDISVTGTVSRDGSAVHFGSGAFLLSAHGNITIEGTGGARAVYIDESVTAPIELNSGRDLSITGRPSNDSLLVSDGVYIGSGNLVAQNSVMIDGRGIAGKGVAVHGKVNAINGSVSITGRTPATLASTDNNVGVLINSDLTAAGPIHITGTTEVFAGTATNSTSQGVSISSSSQVISNDAVTIEGTYVSIPVPGQEGFYIVEGVGVRNDGNVYAFGDITVRGTASFAGTRSFGVIAGGLRSSNGQVNITGSGAEADFSSGVLMTWVIEGFTGATITGNNRSSNPSPAVGSLGGGWTVASAAGSVQITGEAVAARFGGGVDFTEGTITAHDNISITGTATGRPAGVKLGSGVSLSTTVGDITIDGTGGERAVYFDEQAFFPVALNAGHDISITGHTSSSSPQVCDGVYIGSGDLTAQNSVVIDGTGTAGMGIAVHGKVKANNGSLTITGHTPAVLALSIDNTGVLIDGALTAAGPILITGTTEVFAGTATNSASQGVSISSSSQVISNDAVTIEGTYTSIPVPGQEGFYIVEGVGVRNAGNVYAFGDITVRGTASFAGTRSFGVIAGGLRSSNGQVNITGSSAEADFSNGVLVTWVIEGFTGATITGNNRSSAPSPAVGSFGGGWTITSAAGSVQITGEAVAASFGSGVDLSDGTITTRDNIVITGTATGGSAGVKLGSGVSLTTTLGNISILGTGGTQAVGVDVRNSSSVNLSAGHNISITGSRGATRMPGDGVVILVGNYTAQGNIDVVGTGIGAHAVGIKTTNALFAALGVVKLDGRNDFAADDDSVKTGTEGAAVKTGDVTFVSAGGPTELKGTSLDGLPAGGAISISGGVLRTSGRDLLLNPGLAGVRFPKKDLDVSTFDGNATYGTVSFSPGARFYVAINGRTPDIEFDRFVVDGKVNLAGAQLTASGDYALFRSVSAASDNLYLVLNVSTQPTLGQFANAPDSQALRLGSRIVKVAYGKSDNDVSLQSVSFDFNASTTQNEATYTSVLANALYSDATGFGWLSAPTAVVRSGPVGYRVLQDFHEGTDNTFRVKLPNGNYTVTVTLGDNDFSRAASVKVNGVLVLDRIATSKGQFVHRTFDVTVTDGKVDMQFLGINGKFALNAIGIDVNPRGNITIKELGRSLDSNGNLVVNFQGVTDINFANGAVVTLTTSRGTFNVNGFSDSSKEYAGSQIDPGPTGLFNFSILASSFGPLTVTAEHAAGSRFGMYTTTLVAPSSRKLDFNVVGSPTATGTVGVLPTQTFNSANPVTPFGWKTWTTGLDDVLNTNALRRDGHLGTDNTFSIQVDRSQPAYSVTVYLGDSRNQRDNVQVWVEGNLITAASGVTTAAGAFTSLTTTLASSSLSADGILDIRFVDLGGLSTQFLVNGIDLNAVAAPGTLLAAGPAFLSSVQTPSNITSATVQVASPLQVTPTTQSQSTNSAIATLNTRAMQVMQSDSLLSNRTADTFVVPPVIASKPLQIADELWATPDFLDEMSSLVAELKVSRKTFSL